MAAAAQEPKADTRAALFRFIRENYPRGDPISTAGLRNNGFVLRGTLVGLAIAVDGRSLGRPDMENTHTFMCNASPHVHVIGGSPCAKDPSYNGTPIGLAVGHYPIDGDAIPFFLPVVSCGSPGPQKPDVLLERDIAAFDKLIPKHIKENLAIKGNLAAAFTKERVGIRPTVRLASFASSSTNPGGVAESETSLLLDSGAGIHAVGDARLLTGIEFFSIDMWAVCADGTRLRRVGTGTLQMDGFRIPKVQLVHGLKDNLISVSQLDEDHGLRSSFHSKQCKVRDHGGTVVGRGKLQDGGTYKLYSLVVPAEPEE